ncbi:hypothetical protein CBU02nite_12900 [Clostridium butyricum]|uniref:Uncharacterized protein n=1 Tax=Clostridium butyricum TaxID=1492 RepID=A0A512TKK3_CLOBU|nr:hypothetical protein [Clostridium butyricum]NOW23571.1 hypothetical protein [Clostridium butyricum]GEQ20784.1 hypothetical protein CBU02nite_12900 [Clostridium butyricum]
MRFLEQIFLIVFQTSLTAGIIILIIFAILKLFNNNLNIRVKYISVDEFDTNQACSTCNNTNQS